MKIAIITCVARPYIGGIGEASLSMARLLKESGFEVDLITARYEKSWPCEEFFDGIKIIRLDPILCFGKAAILRGLFKTLFAYDVAHIQYPFFGVAEPVALWCLFGKNKPRCLMTYHMDVQFSGLFGIVMFFYYRFFMPMILHRVERIIVSSFDYIKNSKAKNFFEKYPMRFLEIPFCVDPLYLNKATSYVSDEKKSRKKVLFVGGLDRAHYFKGVDVLLSAISKLDDLYSCVIVGDGDMRSEYEKKSKKLAVSDRVAFVGRVSDDELVRLYDESAMVVLPSTQKNEAFGIVLIQGMARSKPVIASDLPGVRGVVNHGVNGLTISPNDHTALSIAIRRLGDDPNFAKRLGENGFKSVQKFYTPKKVGELLRKLYENL